MQEQFDAVERVQTALSAVDLDDIGFVMEMSSAGRVVLRLLTYGPAEKFGISGVYPGWLILVENSVPEPFRRGPHRDRQPAVAHVNNSRLKSVQAAAHPNLEVLGIGVWDGGPLSLAPVTELPRLRTLTAYSGTLANPLEIALLNRLEFLELGPEEWRVLLNAAAVPRSLLAAAIHVPRNLHPLSIVSLANELLSLWGRPPIVETIVQGHLGRGA